MAKKKKSKQSTSRKRTAAHISPASSGHEVGHGHRRCDDAVIQVTLLPDEPIGIKFGDRDTCDRPVFLGWNRSLLQASPPDTLARDSWCLLDIRADSTDGVAGAPTMMEATKSTTARDCIKFIVESRGGEEKSKVSLIFTLRRSIFLQVPAGALRSVGEVGYLFWKPFGGRLFRGFVAFHYWSHGESVLLQFESFFASVFQQAFSTLVS